MPKYKHEFKWAVIYMIMTVIWALVGKLLDFHTSRIESLLLFNTLSIIPSFIIFQIALIQKRNIYYNKIMTYKQGLISGLIMSIFITILGPLTPLITVGLMSPDLFQNSIKYMVSSNTMSATEAKHYFNMTSFIMNGIIAAPVFGFVFSLIAAFFAKKRSMEVSLK